MTIVGFEIRDDGSANLLVFDPMFKTSPAMHRIIGTSARSENPARLLKAYRRGASYLQKYKVFEIIKYVRNASPGMNTIPALTYDVDCIPPLLHPLSSSLFPNTP